MSTRPKSCKRELESTNLWTSEKPISLQGQTLEEVQSFPYLGGEVDQSGKVQKEIAVRLEKASRVYQMWRTKLFQNRNISIATNMYAFRTLVMSVHLCRAETWAVMLQDTRKLKPFQMRCLRDILGSAAGTYLPAEHSGP